MVGLRSVSKVKKRPPNGASPPATSWPTGSPLSGAEALRRALAQASRREASRGAARAGDLLAWAGKVLFTASLLLGVRPLLIQIAPSALKPMAEKP
jgi:hypothetical protein